MFGIGFPELVVIFIVALLVLGPERLPQVARSLAKWVNEFRRAADELKKELGAEELEQSRDELQKVRQELLKKVYVPPAPEPDSSEASPQEKSPKEAKEAQKVSVDGQGSKT